MSRTPRAVMLAVVTMLIAFVAPAGAQPSPPASHAVELVAITPEVRGNAEPLRLELRAPSVASADTVRVMIYNRVTRATLRALADGDLRPSQVGSNYNPIARRVGDLTQEPPSTFVLSVANEQLPRTPGVYPLQITVGTSNPILTWLVRTAPLAAGETPFSLGLVVPVQAPLADQPDGSVTLDDAERSRLAQLASVLAEAPGALTVVPNPETLDALDASGPDARATLQQLQRATRTQTVLRAPYVPLDIDAWRRAGRDDHVSLQLRTGLDIASRTLARDPSTIVVRTAIANHFDTPRSLDLLRREGAANVVIADDHLEPLRKDAFPSPFAQSFRVRDTEGQDLLGAAADTWLAGMITAIDTARQPQPAAQAVLADLATGFFDRPTLARGSVVVLPDRWAPSSSVSDHLFAMLRTAEIVQPRDIETWFATVARSSPEGEARAESATFGPLRRTMVSVTGPDIGDHAAALDVARRSLESYAALFAPAAPSPLDTIDELLLAASDVALTSTERARYVDAALEFVSRSIRTPDGRIGIVVPESERITLTSRRETIRLEVENRLSTRAVVRIDLRSEKLSFPNGTSLLTTLEPGPNTIEVDVAVKASGDSLLEYTVNAPTGSLGELAKGKVQVRSIALSGLGLVLSIVAVAVLVLWWVRHGMRSRHARRALAASD